jgi:hypothetical protein
MDSPAARARQRGLASCAWTFQLFSAFHLSSLILIVIALLFLPPYYRKTWLLSERSLLLFCVPLHQLRTRGL